MAERLIAMQDNNQFQTLCGSFDENLKLLEQRYHVQMICRGDELRIQGDGAAVELAAGAVTALLKMIAAGQAVTPQSIHYVSDMVDEGASGQLAELADDDTVCLTAAGKPVHTRTVGQRSYVRAIAENTIVFGLGPAGTGKTYLAVAMAVRAFRRHEISRIILTRPAVEAGEKLGFLPGDLQDKVDPYLRPLYDGLFEMLGAEAFQRHLERGSIEVAPLAYMRGRTLDNAFIILDEAQNTTGEQMKMFLTRLGEGSRMVITGDTTQIDLPDKQKSGLVIASRILRKVDDIAVCEFTNRDVVRHKLVQDIIRALEPGVQIGRLYVVPFGDCQREISVTCPSNLRVIMYRRIMYSVAERIAHIEGAKAIVTGESLGQVASQTLENIMAVNEAVKIPVFRPLIGSDKQEIIARAEEIGTFDISTEAAPDCCTLFMPRRPETHAKLDAVHEAWELFDHEEMIERLLKQTEYIDFESNTYKAPKTLKRKHSELAPREIYQDHE